MRSLFRTLVFGWLSFSFFSLSAQDSLSLDDIFIKNKFSPQSFTQLNFINSENYTTQENLSSSQTSKIWMKSILNDQKELIFDSQELKDRFGLKSAIVDGFQWIEDGVFWVNLQTESIYRRSRKSQVYLVNQAASQIIQVAGGQKIMNATLSPDLKKIAYVLDNNIFILHVQTSKVEQVTFDGKKNHIINGLTDWCYEEEFSIVNTLRWSDNSEYLAYLKFDESEVKEFQIELYNNDYPEHYQYKYPRAGEDVSKVSAWVYKNKKNHRQIPVEADYIPLLKWKDAQTLSLLTLNRLQNELKVINYDFKNKFTGVWYQEEDKRYVDVPQLFSILSGGILAISSEKSGYNHLYLIDENDNETQVTKGQFEIKDVLRVDLKDSVIVFSSYLPTPEHESILKWDMKTEQLTYLSDTTGVTEVRMIGNGSYVESFSNQYVRNKITVKSVNSDQALVLLNDTREEDAAWIKKEFFWLPIDDYVLRAWKMLPPDFDSTKKYPVLFYVYGGPVTQTVKENWGRNQQHWLKYMAYQGFVVVSVENRGTYGRGADFKKMTYGKLGQLEVEDQLKSIQYFNQLPYIDSSKVFMFGWSYGGFMTLMSMVQGVDLVQGGISVAPVTDWRFYDAIYTERFMRTPVGNERGYQKSSILMNAEKLTGDLLLIHGTADDNVHYQNSLELSKKLIQHNKQFQMLSYPNGHHGIGGALVQLHLYTTITDFILKKLKEIDQQKSEYKDVTEVNYH